ncbi:exonuclease domain-containing protein [Amnibacterium kyonggiense]
MPGLRDVVVPVAIGGGLGVLLRAAGAVSERRRTVGRVQDMPTLLFDLEAPTGPAEPAEPVAVVSTWRPPAPEPAPVAVPLLLLTDEPEPAAEPSPAGPSSTEPGAVRSAAPAEPERPLPAWASALGVFDLETTGVDTSVARIVTAHVGVIDETGAVVERKDWIVDPGVPIPEGAAAVHGITDERARRFGRPPAEVVAEILAAIRSVFLRGFPLVVYNAPYDLTLLAAEAERHRLWPLEVTAPIVDPFVLDKEVDRFRRGKRTLTAAAAEYAVPLTDAHDAGADAIAAGRLAQAIARRHPDALAMEAQELHDAQVAWCADQAERFQAYMREKRDPAFTASGGWPKR